MFHVAFGIVLGVFFLILIYYVIIPWLFLFLASRETLGEEYEVGFEFVDNKEPFRVIAKVKAESVEQAIAVATIKNTEKYEREKSRRLFCTEVIPR